MGDLWNAEKRVLGLSETLVNPPTCFELVQRWKVLLLLLLQQTTLAQTLFKPTQEEGGGGLLGGHDGPAKEDYYNVENVGAGQHGNFNANRNLYTHRGRNSSRGPFLGECRSQSGDVIRHLSRRRKVCKGLFWSCVARGSFHVRNQACKYMCARSPANHLCVGDNVSDAFKRHLWREIMLWVV